MSLLGLRLTALCVLVLLAIAGGVDLYLERSVLRSPATALTLPAHLIDALESTPSLSSPLIGTSGSITEPRSLAGSRLDFENADCVVASHSDGVSVTRNPSDNQGQGGALEIEARDGGRTRLQFELPLRESGFLELSGRIRIYTRLPPAEVMQTLRSTRRLPQVQVSLEASAQAPPERLRVQRVAAPAEPPLRAVALLPERQAIDIFSFAKWQPFRVPVKAAPGTQTLRVQLDVYVPAFIVGLDDFELSAVDPLSTVDPIGRFRFAGGNETTARLKKMIRAGDEDRISLLALPGTIAEFQVQLLERSRLDFGALLWSMQGFDATGAMRSLRVKVTGDDDQVVEREYSFVAASEPTWQEARLDLTSLGSQPARVLVQAPPDADWRLPPYLMLGDPCISAQRPDYASPKGVILVTLDALSAEHLGSHGYPRATTPTLDRISKEGVSFLRATSPSPSTYTTLPGLMASSHRRDGWRELAARLSPQTVTLPEAFTRGGYLVKPFIADFYFNSFFKGFYSRPYAYAGATNQTEKIDEWLVAELIEWVRSVKDRRFFACLHTNQPHGPNRPYPEHDLFRSEPDVVAAERALEDYSAEHPVENARSIAEIADQISLQRKHHPREMVKHAETVLCALYDGAIHQADALVATIDAALCAEGLDDEVVLVLSADHGWPLAPLVHPEQIVPEASLLVPLIIRGPTVSGRVTVTSRVSTIDLSTTLLDLAGVPAPPSFEGITLRPYFLSPDLDFDRFVPGQSMDHVVGYLREWKLVVERGQFLERRIELTPDSVHLFDLEHDPKGEVNVVMEHEDVARELWQKLDDWHFSAAGAFEDVTLSNLLIGHFQRAGYLQERR